MGALGVAGALSIPRTLPGSVDLMCVKHAGENSISGVFAFVFSQIQITARSSPTMPFLSEDFPAGACRAQ